MSYFGRFKPLENVGRSPLRTLASVLLGAILGRSFNVFFGQKRATEFIKGRVGESA